MKARILVRRKKSMVTLSGYGVTGTRKKTGWVENEQLLPGMIRSVALAAGDLSESMSALGNEQFLPGNLVALGYKGLSFAFELPAGYRTVEVYSKTKYDLADRFSRKMKLYQVWVPSMLIFVQYSSSLRLDSVHFFFIKEDKLPFTDPRYLNQALYCTAFPNQYMEGGLCMPDTPVYAANRSLTTLVNTAMEGIFGSSFNGDMHQVPHGLRGSDELYDRKRHKGTHSSLFKRWAAMEPEAVDKITWVSSATSIARMLTAYRINLKADPFPIESNLTNRMLHGIWEASKVKSS